MANDTTYSKVSLTTQSDKAQGIYILANDIVLDQLIALIHSIEENIGRQMPICVVPYDDNTQQSRKATQTYAQVQWFDNRAILEKWETFATKIWQAHPTALRAWAKRGVTGVNRMGMHRRFCCFDGPFKKFIYLDADILAMNSFDLLFDSLDEHDFVTYDFQYKDLSHVFDINAPSLTAVFEQARLDTEIFCAGMFASKKGAFTDEMLTDLLTSLQAGEAEILYFHGPDQAILNYMVLKSGIDAINLSRTLPEQNRTGCCVTSPHFSEKENVLFDKEEQLIYLHYIGISSRFFRQICTGKNVIFPYRDLFLHYRYLREASQPVLIGEPIAYDRPILTNKRKMAYAVREWAIALMQQIPGLNTFLETTSTESTNGLKNV
ncbi:MAG: Npun_R2821/Npun_R2822 family protein [Cyanobacteria bacterium J06650_10]